MHSFFGLKLFGMLFPGVQIQILLSPGFEATSLVSDDAPEEVGV